MVPLFHEVTLPLLQLVVDGQEHRLSQLAPAIAAHFKLTEEDLKERLPSGRQTRFRNRLAWAKVYLERAGLVETIGPGLFRITQRGKDLLASKPKAITLNTLRQYPEFAAFEGKSVSKDKSTADVTLEEKVGTPEEALDAAYEKLRSQLAQQILAMLMKGSPEFFENLVVDVLVAMGYGGSEADAGEAIGRSGDGGIDGIIKEDRLGLDVIYLQAKRWANPVGSKEVRDFSGSLDGHGARKGVFITTSKFTTDACDYAKRVMQKKIVLIDGEQLAQLMIDYDVGVTPAKTYSVKKIDPEFFEVD